MLSNKYDFRKLAHLILARLSAVMAIGVIALVWQAGAVQAALPPLQHYDACTRNPAGNNPYVDAQTNVAILASNGLVERYSRSFRVRVTAVDPMLDGVRQYRDEELDLALQNMASPAMNGGWAAGKRSEHTSSREFTVNNLSGNALPCGLDTRSGLTGPTDPRSGMKLVFSTGWPGGNPNTWILDCLGGKWRDGRYYGIQFKFELLDVGDMPAGQSYELVGPGNFISPYNMAGNLGSANGTAFGANFKVRPVPGGNTIQGLKVEYQGTGTPTYKPLPSGVSSAITVRARGTSPGGMTKDGLCLGAPLSCNGYYILGLRNDSYEVYSAPNQVSGWKMVGYYIFDSTNRYMRFHPLTGGIFNTGTLRDGTLLNVWVAYERDAKFYPWLQSKDGNIVSLGKIVGQQIGQPGGRDSGATDKEAENVIISQISVTNFCSTNAYLLGSASNGSCAAGKYEVNPDTLPVVAGQDRIINDLTRAWADNGSGTNATNCTGHSNYFTQILGGHSTLDNLPTSDIAAVSGGARCDNGVIWRHNGNTRTSDISYNKGRATIWVQGNLTITRDIKRSISGTYGSASEAPNLGLIVEGNITIEPGVKQIDAAVYATGKITTCSESSNSGAGKCREQLKVNGLLASKDGFDYGRRYVSSFGGGTGDSAELVSYSGQILAFPPPGFGYFDLGVSSRIKYLGEKSPRF